MVRGNFHPQRCKSLVCILAWFKLLAFMQFEFPVALAKSYVTPLGVYNPNGLRTPGGQEFVTCV